MMLESKLSNFSINSLKYFPVGITFGGIFLIIVFYEIDLFFDSNYNPNNFYLNIYQNWYDLIDSTNDVEVYGQVLYSYYVLHFLISGLILLLVLIGVVTLTNNLESKRVVDQSLFKQLSRNSKSLFTDQKDE